MHVGATDTPAAQKAVRQADALMVTIQPVTAELIASMARCRLAARIGTGLDAIDLDAVRTGSIAGAAQRAPSAPVNRVEARPS